MKTNLRANYFYQLSYRVVTFVTPLITAPYISRVLGAEGIGEYSYTYTISHYFLIFAVLGTSQYGSRAIAREREKKENRNRIFSEIFSLRIMLSVIIAGLYFLYVNLCASSKTLAYMQGLNVISTLFDVTWFLFGMELFKVTTLRNISVKIITILLIMLCVKSSSDVWKYTLIMAGGTLLGQLSVWSILHKYVQFKPVKIRDALRHLKPNLILFLPVIADNLLGYFDKIMIGNMSTSVELGCYDNAEKMLSIPNSLVTALCTVTLPRISNYVAIGNKKQVKQMMRRSMFFVVFATSAVAFGIAAVAKEFVPLFFGPGFDLVIPLVYVLMPYILLVSWENVTKTQCLIPNNKDKEFVFCLMAGAVLNVILNIVLIPRRGAVGAAFATVISKALIAILETVLAGKDMETRVYIKQCSPFILIGIIMYVVIRNISLKNGIMTFLGKVGIGAIIYLMLATLYVFRRHKDIWNTFFKK